MFDDYFSIFWSFNISCLVGWVGIVAASTCFNSQLFDDSKPQHFMRRVALVTQHTMAACCPPGSWPACHLANLGGCFELWWYPADGMGYSTGYHIFQTPKWSWKTHVGESSNSQGVAKTMYDIFFSSSHELVLRIVESLEIRQCFPTRQVRNPKMLCQVAPRLASPPSHYCKLAKSLGPARRTRTLCQTKCQIN